MMLPLTQNPVGPPKAPVPGSPPRWSPTLEKKIVESLRMISIPFPPEASQFFLERCSFSTMKGDALMRERIYHRREHDVNMDKAVCRCGDLSGFEDGETSRSVRVIYYD